MQCPQSQEQLSAWIDGDLTPQEHQIIDEHLAHCPVCQAVVEDLRAMQGAAAQLAQEPSAADNWAAVTRRVAPVNQLESKAKKSKGWVFLAAAAGLAALALTFMALWHDGTPREPLTVQRARQELALLQVQQQRTTAALQAAIDRGQLRWDPLLKKTFANNLALVDAAIKECRRNYSQRPGDLALQTSLMAAMQRKVEFLEIFAGLGKTP